MLDYFINADESFLRGMGIDRTKFQERQAWLDRILKDQQNPDDKKVRFYLAWIYEGRHVGHSSVNSINIGEHAVIHLHLYEPELRRNGVGAQFFKMSVDFVLQHFNLKKLICEPFSENPAPNRVMNKLGFKLVKSYKTTPTPISFEQIVNRYEIDRI